ncbi:MAG: hypothetical protein HY694_13130, partial [Deltaproteobacteria bacterium]|nr:hypothetical protein [Deltaproteobacteria bacterium]
VFTVSLSSASPQTVTVNFTTVNDTATSGSDYVANKGTLTFKPGETSKTITIKVNGDTLFEPDETLFVNLSNPINATLADGQGKGTITNDDPELSLTISDVTVTEGNSGTTNAVFTVSLSAASGQIVTVDFATADGTAKAGSDYVAKSGTLTIKPGQTEATIVIEVNGDKMDEPDETFYVNLSKANGAKLQDAQGQATIIDTDAPPKVAFDQTDSLSREWVTAANLGVSLSAASGKTVTVDYAVTGGTATGGGVDYSLTSGTLIFEPGETSKSIPIDIVNDKLDEPDETVEITLSNPSNATLGTNRVHTYTIMDDDPLRGFNSVYMAASGKFPHEVCAPWTLNSNSPTDPFFSDGNLIISTQNFNENIVYRQTAPDISMPDPLVIEARVRFIDGVTTNSSRAPISISFVTAPNVGNTLYIAKNEIFILSGPNRRGARRSLSTRFSLHTYRIEVSKTGAIKVFYDGSLMLNGSTFTNFTSTGAETIEWGEGSGAAFGASEWEFFRHNASTVSCLDHFLCYSARRTPGTSNFPPRIALEDQFEEGIFEVHRPERLCNPADKNSEGINDLKTHLLGYEMDPDFVEEPAINITNIKVQNQFHPAGSELVVDLIETGRLLVPANKDRNNPVEPPDNDAHTVDHYKCYTVRVSDGAPAFQALVVSVDDQFTESPKLFEITRPLRLCAPADKNRSPNPANLRAGGEGVKNQGDHLMCYEAAPVQGEPEHSPATGIHMNNQFFPERIDTIKEEEFCVPSTLGEGENPQ